MLNLSLMTLIPKTGLRLQVNAVINLGDNLVRTKATTAVYPSRKRTRINNRLLRRNLIRVQKTRRAHVTVKVPVPETKVLNAIPKPHSSGWAKDPAQIECNLTNTQHSRNLSSIVFTSHQTRTLANGLKFIPTPRPSSQVRHRSKLIDILQKNAY